MNKVSAWCLYLVSGVLLFFGSVSLAQAEYFVIDNFDVDINIAQTSELTVTENIAVTFSEPRHGIFRNIPLDYTDDLGLAYRLRLDVLNVTNEDGSNRPYKVSHSDGNISIRIGDADVYVDGKQVYQISYKVERGMRFFEDYDELYWNVTGNGWGTEINQASTTISWPEGMGEDAGSICFTGFYGSAGKDCIITAKTDNSISLATTAPLGLYQGFSVGVSLPKGYITPPSTAQELWWMISDNWGFLLPFIMLIFMIHRFLKYGRDPDLKKTVIAFYEPPDDLTPAEVGTIFDESADMKDISAEIVQLAVAGYLRIEEKDEKGFFFNSKKYTFHKTEPKRNAKGLNEYQQAIMNGIFGGGDKKELDKLRNKFYRKIPKINEMLYNSMLNRKYFPKHPHTVRDHYLYGALLIGVPITIIAGVWERFDVLIGAIVSTLIVIAFSFYMPAKTRKGAEIFWKAKGFKEYINTAERYRIKFQEDQKIFEKFLPYAMVFGIADKWSKAFEGIYNQQPDWYQGSQTGQFSTNNFLNSINGLSASMNATMTSAPSSSGSSGSSSFGGGGFSGGGFGGGGGGSW